MNETPSCIIVVTQCNFTEFKQLKGWLHGSYQKLSFFQCQKWVRDLLETSFVPFLYSVKINLPLGFPAFSPMGLVEVGMDLSEMTFFTQLPRRRDSESIKRNSTLGTKHSGRSKMENFTRYRTCRTHKLCPWLLLLHEINGFIYFLVKKGISSVERKGHQCWY